MSNKVLLKKSSVLGKAPETTDLDYGELALNYADGLLYFKNASNNIQSFAAYNSSTVTLTATQTLTNKTLTSPTLNTPSINGGSVSLANGTLVVPASASPSQTDTGSIVYDSAFGVLTVGNGSGRKLLVDTSTTQTLTNKTLTAASLGNAVLTGTLSAGGGVGTNNQYLKSTGTGVAWATLPTYTLVAATTSTLGGVIVGSGLNVSDGTISLDSNIAATLSGNQTLSNKTIDSLTLTGTLTANGSVGTSGYYLQSTSSGIQWAAVQQGVPSASRITSNTNATAGSSYIADTTAGTFTITLPASPATGDTIIVSDGGTFATTPLTVSRNTKTIENVAADLSLNINGVSVTLSYDGSTWQVYTQVGASGGSEVTLAGNQTLTNKTISGSSNTLTNIGNSSLTNSSVTINGTSVSLGSSGTVTAAADTLTGTTLKSTVVNSSLTSVGTLTNVTVAGAASVTANSATDKYVNIGTHGQMFDDGNFHIHATDGALWLNSLNGSDINLGLQSNSGTSVAKANSLHMNAGYGSIAPTFGVRAWISCGYIGSSMVTNASGNLSVSRISAGKYQFTFGTSMPDENYSVTATAKTPVNDSDVAANLGYNTTTQTSGFIIHCARYGSGYIDVPQLCIQVVR